MNQIILKDYIELEKYFHDNQIDNIFVVGFDMMKEMEIYSFLENLPNVKKTYFMNFKPNPTYESVCDGLKEFKKSKSQFILAIGGGSALDVSKCIKLFSSLDGNKNFLEQNFTDNNVTLMAIPTTAGTGSEATRFAVIYYNGKKQSVTHDSIIPKIVLFDANLLNTLPLYQKKATVFDALSHAIESFWSVNSTDKSKKYSQEAIRMIIKNIHLYLNGDNTCNNEMLMASNYAGQAINITQTTAGHAMCYKLTSLYGISHGHAAMLINSCLLPFMIDNINKCIDIRGVNYLKNVFSELVKCFQLNDLNELKNYLTNLLDEYDLYNVDVNSEDLNELVNSVNIERLKNNPIKLDNNDIRFIYEMLFKKIEKRKKNGSK